MATLPPSYVPQSHLPAYGETGTSSAVPIDTPIDSSLPTSFTINGKEVQPLVRPSDLRAHLVLLGAFLRLREEIHTQKQQACFPTEPNDRWTVFIAKAVYRFQCWVERIMVHGEDQEDREMRGILREDECPPLDVVMVWLVYMLVG